MIHQLVRRWRIARRSIHSDVLLHPLQQWLHKSGIGFLYKGCYFVPASVCPACNNTTDWGQGSYYMDLSQNTQQLTKICPDSIPIEIVFSYPLQKAFSCNSQNISTGHSTANEVMLISDVFLSHTLRRNSSFWAILVFVVTTNNSVNAACWFQMSKMQVQDGPMLQFSCGIVKSASR